MRLFPYRLGFPGGRGGTDAMAGRVAVHTATLLPDGRLKRIEAAAGTRVTCLTGRLWITFAGDGVDHLLGPGESYVAPGAGLVLVQAMATSTFNTVDVPAGRRAFLWAGWN